jgi:hypothetical protein
MTFVANIQAIFKIRFSDFEWYSICTPECFFLCSYKRHTHNGTQHTIQSNIVFVSKLCHIKHLDSILVSRRKRAKTGWLGVSITCPIEGTCLHADCGFKDL